MLKMQHFLEKEREGRRGSENKTGMGEGGKGIGKRSRWRNLRPKWKEMKENRSGH